MSPLSRPSVASCRAPAGLSQRPIVAPRPAVRRLSCRAQQQQPSGQQPSGEQRGQPQQQPQMRQAGEQQMRQPGEMEMRQTEKQMPQMSQQQMSQQQQMMSQQQPQQRQQPMGQEGGRRFAPSVTNPMDECPEIEKQLGLPHEVAERIARSNEVSPKLHLNINMMANKFNDLKKGFGDKMACDMVARMPQVLDAPTEWLLSHRDELRKQLCDLGVDAAQLDRALCANIRWLLAEPWMVVEKLKGSSAAAGIPLNKMVGSMA